MGGNEVGLGPGVGEGLGGGQPDELAEGGEGEGSDKEESKNTHDRRIIKVPSAIKFLWEIPVPNIIIGVKQISS